jgi:hypothetical protein
LDGCLASTDDVDVIGIGEYLRLFVEYCAGSLQFCSSYDYPEYEIEEKRQ